MTPPPVQPSAPWAHPARRGHRFTKKTARRIIARDRTCQLQLPGCTTEATQADHIIGVMDALAAGWEPADVNYESNGQGVCDSCHQLKTRGEIQRGQARAAAKRSRRRPEQQHPGLLH